MELESITFEQLRAKLLGLGFTLYRIEVSNNGTRGWHFERNESPNASFYLPDYKEGDIVEPFDLSAILTTLRSRGLLEESARLGSA